MSKQCFRNSLLILASLFLIAAKPAPSDDPKGKREPIVITANRMQADKLADKVTFKGNVFLKKEGMTLTSDSMIVFYDPPSKGIREIEAFGNVIVRNEGRVAHSKKAFYYSKEEKIVLIGDARIIEKDNQLGGERITLFMRDDRSIVEGGKVMFYQEDQKKPEGRKGK